VTKVRVVRGYPAGVGNRLWSMTGEATGDELVDIVELLAQSGLTAVDQRRVHNALVNNMIEGWMPDRQALLRLVDFVAGRNRR
jgi:hypothetical protein